MSQKSIYITPRAIPYCPLAIAGAFKELTPRQRLYAHHVMWASWSGTAVVARQASSESLPALRMFHKILSAKPLADLKASAQHAGVSEEEVIEFLEYVALLYSNMGNYLSFGDSKFIPACSKDAFTRILKSCGGSAEVDQALVETIYDLDPSKLTLDFSPKGITNYYNSSVTAEDAATANAYLAELKLDGSNTRVFKRDDGRLEIHFASAEKKTVLVAGDGPVAALVYGDHSVEMKRVVEHMREARKSAENATQERMIDHYIAHFAAGDINEHKQSQREWVKDVGPVVETNIGFIETYRDPSGVRAEWEGFVAVVNKDQSKKYATLVSHAEEFIAKLPWGKDFEKDTFASPDFTSLDVLGFASSGIPSGINIPNYDDIRQEYGFKNVYLANVVNAMNFNEKPNHITEADWAVYREGIISAMSVNVGTHELLGHGTGKLLMESGDGNLNFDKNAVVDPISGKLVTTWYKPGETWGGLFGSIASSYEECRAEAVSLYLCVQPNILSIFDRTTEADRRSTVFSCWLNMVRAGLLGLEFYTPETQQWRQAHMRARFCILQSLLRAENPVVRIVPDEKEGLVITLDTERIATDGVKVIGELLVNLHVNKCTANVKRGTDYYCDLTTVDEQFVKYREIVLEKRKPRKQYVQPHTSLSANGEVVLHEFPGTMEGALEAFVARHKEIPL